MMAGGAGSSYRDWNPDQLSRALREESEKAVEAFDVDLAEYLNELLGMFNGRDVQLTRDRLVEALEVLTEDLRGARDLMFGGSVAKHTYVDGLSDIDSLLILDGPKYEGRSPKAALDQMAATLSARLDNTIQVETGSMAITLTYADGMKIQLLPALREADQLRVPSFVHDGWASINPENFQRVLVARNAECGGKLVPTVKLAKAVISNFSERYRLSGYHVESLAISAFKGYDGIKTTSRMLPYLFERAKDLVLTPIRDKTGQSLHVDEYLGEANNSLRQEIGHLLGGIAKRMKNASSSKSRAGWTELFESE